MGTTATAPPRRGRGPTLRISLASLLFLLAIAALAVLWFVTPDYSRIGGGALHVYLAAEREAESSMRSLDYQVNLARARGGPVGPQWLGFGLRPQDGGAFASGESDRYRYCEYPIAEVPGCWVFYAWPRRYGVYRDVKTETTFALVARATGTDEVETCLLAINDPHYVGSAGPPAAGDVFRRGPAKGEPDRRWVAWGSGTLLDLLPVDHAYCQEHHPARGAHDAPAFIPFQRAFQGESRRRWTLIGIGVLSAAWGALVVWRRRRGLGRGGAVA